jgi:light-regulated signal transduction histidine kinase (bacteriophytochrome)
MYLLLLKFLLSSFLWKIIQYLKSAHCYEIKISDNGIGFEQEYAENIFKLFQRLHGRNEYYGTGIGLAICKKKFVENHRGTITAAGKPGRGSSVYNSFTCRIKQILWL